MTNKIGMDDYNFQEVEYKLVNAKLNLINELFTFNEKDIGIEYLKKINCFLFSDIYLDNDIGFRELSVSEMETINDCLKNIVETCILNQNNIEKILRYFEKIWKYQPFITGNTRTLIAFLKILKNAF